MPTIQGHFSIRRFGQSGAIAAVALVMLSVLLPTAASAQVFAGEPSISLQHDVNGVPADTAGTAVMVAPSSSLTWTFVVTNDGGADLANVEILSQFVQTSAIACAGSGDNLILLLAVGATVTCTASSVAVGTAFTTITTQAIAIGTPVDIDGVLQPTEDVDDLNAAVVTTTDYAGVMLVGAGGTLSFDNAIPTVPEFQAAMNRHGESGPSILPTLALAVALAAAAAVVATRRPSTSR